MLVPLHSILQQGDFYLSMWLLLPLLQFSLLYILVSRMVDQQNQQ